MSKKILALLLSVLMVVSLFPLSAAAAAGDPVTFAGNNIDNLVVASEGALTGQSGTYNLNRDLKITSHIEIKTDTTINLNGNTLERVDPTNVGTAQARPTTLYVNTSGVTLTVNGGTSADDNTVGTVKSEVSVRVPTDGALTGAVVNVANGAAVLNYVKVEGADMAINPNGSGNVTLNYCDVTSTGYTPIPVGGTAQLTISGGKVTSTEGFAIGTNGKETDDAAKITVNNGAQIITTYSDASAIFLPRGTLTVEGAETTIKGPAGIVVRGGTVNFVNGKVVATGNELGYVYAGSGADPIPKVPCAAIAVNQMIASADSYGKSYKVTITDGSFEAPADQEVISYSKDGDAKTEEADLATADITVNGGEFSAPLLSTSFLGDGLQYEAKSSDPNTPYSYHKTLEKAVEAAGANGEVAAVVGDNSTINSRVLSLKNANGDNGVTLETTFDKETAIYKVEISGAVKPSTSDDAGAANYWLGIGIKAPDGYTGVAYAVDSKDGINTPANKFTPNYGDNGAGSLDGFQEGGSGFAFWPAPSAFPEGGDGIYRTLKWTAADKPDYYEVYHFTLKSLTKTGAIIELKEVGYAYDQETASENANAALDGVNESRPDLTDVYKNTMWATFSLQGTPIGPIKVTFENANAKANDSSSANKYSYTETFNSVSRDSTGGIAYFSFEPTHGGASIDPVEGEYTVTVTGGEGDLVVEADPVTLELYKVTVVLAEDEVLGEDETLPDDYYTASATVPQSELPSIKPTKGGKTATGWNQARDGYVITLTPKWTSNSGGVSTPDDDDTEDKDFDYSNCPKDSNCPIAQFKDASVTAWYHNAVHFCLDNGLMSGNGDGTFSPSGTLNRATVVQLLYNMEGKPSDVGPVIFSDVPATAWYADAVRWAASNDIVAGNGDGTFSPESPITREQMAVIFRNFAQNYEGRNVNVVADLANYTDTGKISRWALSAMQWAVGSGLMSGTSSTTLAPLGTSERAQAASVLMKYCLNIAG